MFNNKQQTLGPIDSNRHATHTDVINWVDKWENISFKGQRGVYGSLPHIFATIWNTRNMRKYFQGVPIYLNSHLVACVLEPRPILILHGPLGGGNCRLEMTWACIQLHNDEEACHNNEDGISAHSVPSLNISRPPTEQIWPRHVLCMRWRDNTN